MQDEEIVLLFHNRDEAAIIQAQLKYGSYCRKIVNNILGNDADTEETLNDTWLAAWNSIPPHQPERLGPYLGKLTRCAALRRRRDDAAVKRGGGQLPAALEELDELIPASASAEDRLAERELADVLTRFLLRLPKMQRNVFLRRYWFMESVDQICLAYGFSQSKVHSMLYRSRRKMQDYLKSEGYL